VDQFKNNFLNKKTVGVHVRFSDHRSRLWAILKKLNVLLKREPDLQIFLATDNIQIKSMFDEIYSGVITTPHYWYPTPGLTIHQNRNRPDTIESGIEALVDLYLLTECDYLIIDTSSSFSYVAKLLTKTSDSNIFNVELIWKLPPRLRRGIYRYMLKLGMFSSGLSLLGKLVKIQKLFDR